MYVPFTRYATDIINTTIKKNVFNIFEKISFLLQIHVLALSGIFVLPIIKRSRSMALLAMIYIVFVFINPASAIPAIAFINILWYVISSHAKRSHPAYIITSAYIRLRNNGSLLSIFNNPSFSIIRKKQKYIPHTIKFQLAPCHSPVRNHTIKIFENVFNWFFLLPPNGIYTYSLNHVPSDICHLRQNSVMLLDI